MEGTAGPSATLGRTRFRLAIHLGMGRWMDRAENADIQISNLLLIWFPMSLIVIDHLGG
jgi:hypothetical protein